MLKATIVLVTTIFITACAASPIPELETRAPFDLNCKDVEISKIGHVTYGARGCEKSVTYEVQVCGYAACTIKKIASGVE